MRGLLLAVAACLVVVARIRHRRRQKDIPKIPLVPGTLPLIGNVRAVKAVLAHRFHFLYGEFAEVAGEAGVLRLVVAGKTVLIATSPAAFAAVLQKTGFVPKPTDIYSGVLMFGIKAHSLFSTPDGDEHDRIRRGLTRCFNPDTVAEAVSRLAGNVEAAIAAILSAFAAPGTADDSGAAAEALGVHGGDIAAGGVLVDLECFSISSIMAAFKVFIGLDMSPPVDILVDTLSHVASISIHPAQFKLLRRGLYPGFRRYRRNWQALYDFQAEAVREIFRRPPPADTRTLWAAIRECFPAAMTDTEQFEAALSNVSFMYAAGFETTHNAVTHTLSALALDPDSQDMVVQELQEEGLLATAERPEPSAVTAQQLMSLKALDAVCCESLRLMAPVPGTARTLTRDTDIGGFQVPKGTDVVLAVGALHVNESAWGTDAAKWRPQRWLEGRSRTAMRKDGAGHNRFLPFLDGATNCIGQHLALTELKMVVAMVLCRLHVSMDPGRMGHLRSVEDYIGETLFFVTLQRATPAWLRMRPRVAQP